MSKTGTVKDVHQLAEIILEDIRKKGLRAGDKYMAATEVASMLKVSTVTAHRAMTLLSDQAILHRKRKSGTFIGEGFKMDGAAVRAGLRSIHILIENDSSSKSISTDEITSLIYESFPDVALQMHIVPEDDAYYFSKYVIDRVSENREKEALILVRSTERVQFYAQEAGINAGILGTSYPGIVGIPSVDADQYGAGVLAAQSQLESACKSFMLVSRSVWRLGDIKLLDGYSDTLAEASVSLKNLKIACLGRNEKNNWELISDYVAQAPKPLGILSRSWEQSEFLESQLEAEGYSKDDYIIVSADCRRSSGRSKRFREILLKDTYRKHVQTLASMVVDHAAGEEFDNSAILGVKISG